MTRKMLAGAALAVVASIGVAGTAMAGGPFGDGRGRGMHDDRWHPVAGILVLVALLAAAALLTWWLVSRRSTPALAAAPGATLVSSTAGAEAILAERLARSEIGPDDYRTLLATLRGDTPTT